MPKPKDLTVRQAVVMIVRIIERIPTDDAKRLAYRLSGEMAEVMGEAAKDRNAP